MSWNLMEEYMDLHSTFEARPFTLREASETLGKPPEVLRKDTHKMFKSLTLERVERGTYRTVEPDKWVGIHMAIKRFPGLTPFFQEIVPKLKHIRSIMVYGSRVRRDHREDSDHDILLVTDGKPLFSEEEAEMLEGMGFQITVNDENGLKKKVRGNPVSIVPALKEGLVVYNGHLITRLLENYRKENLLKDLKEISRDVIPLNHIAHPGADLKRSIIFLSFVRSRQMYLIECLMAGRAFHRGDWLEKMWGLWQLTPEEVQKLHMLYKKIETGGRPRMDYATQGRLKNITEGNVGYLNESIKLFDEAG